MTAPPCMVAQEVCRDAASFDVRAEDLAACMEELHKAAEVAAARRDQVPVGIDLSLGSLMHISISPLTEPGMQRPANPTSPPALCWHCRRACTRQLGLDPAPARWCCPASWSLCWAQPDTPPGCLQADGNLRGLPGRAARRPRRPCS